MFSKSKATLWDRAWQLTNAPFGAIRRNMRKILCTLPLMAISGLSAATSACVQISAPDKPIVINLNIAIRQEILYKLDAASKKVIDENPEIF